MIIFTPTWEVHRYNTSYILILLYRALRAGAKGKKHALFQIQSNSSLVETKMLFLQPYLSATYYFYKDRRATVVVVVIIVAGMLTAKALCDQ